MAFKDYKKGLDRVEDQGVEYSRHLFRRMKYPFSWKNRGSWKSLPPRKHPGWAAYYANKDISY